jgi:FkbM family methyltransferase
MSLNSIIRLVLPTPARSFLGRSWRKFNRKSQSSIGNDFVQDIKSRLPHVNIRTIFDVGGFRGITALEFADAFPNATVYTFEPSDHNYCELRANLIGKPTVRTFRMAFSSSAGVATLLEEAGHPSRTRISQSEAVEGENAIMDTIDRFCETQGITDIDILKIDVEGHEIQVLQGSMNMLSSGSVSIVKAECSIDPDNEYHIRLSAICDILYPVGYRPFGIYEQAESTLVTNVSTLRRFDAAFIAKTLISRG